MNLREEAFKLFKESNGKLKTKEIADILKVDFNKVKYWRNKDKWKARVNKRGAPFGNKNAIGNKGGGAKKGNVNAYKHGLYLDETKHLDKAYLSKILPKTLVNIMLNIHDERPIDKLWKDILILEAKVINMQKINYVSSSSDLTKVLKKKSSGKTESEEYEIRFAFDKESKTISVLSKAMESLARMIKQYDEMVHKDWDLVSEEHRLRVELLRSKLPKEVEGKEEKIDKYFKALEGVIHDK
ncbi:phage terminase small subunit [Clostridium chrysemydis]|uniref:phage terminase small subunit n=1 Tax=Clostridium chrysemydis TaxID=2665504 RepID=UPI0018845B79|nr:phage terminase small subunit [Clostridium chrysemydis]